MFRREARTACFATAAAFVAACGGGEASGPAPSVVTTCIAEGGAIDGAFEEAKLTVVYSATDDDAQIIAEAGVADAMSCARIVGPNGVVTLLSKFDDGDDLGHADLRFDSPEPSLDALMRAYPPGEYVFEATTTAGAHLRSIVPLSYTLLGAPNILAPPAGAADVARNGLVVEWDAPPETTAVHLEIEDEVTLVKLAIDLPADARSFRVPDGWLPPRTEYVLDVKLLHANGNLTVSDLTFTTGD